MTTLFGDRRNIKGLPQKAVGSRREPAGANLYARRRQPDYPLGLFYGRSETVGERTTEASSNQTTPAGTAQEGPAGASVGVRCSERAGVPELSGGARKGYV